MHYITRTFTGAYEMENDYVIFKQVIKDKNNSEVDGSSNSIVMPLI
jgi:hypothetical protein